MLDFFKSYSFTEVVIFIILLALAIKELVTFIDWAKGRIKQAFKKETDDKKEKDSIQQQIASMNAVFAQKEVKFNEKKEEISQNFQDVLDQIKKLTIRLEILMASDKDNIKSYITEKHHYFCYRQGWIDDYSLDCLEKRFGHYKEEGGNSFIKDLMEDLRALPKRSAQ